MTPPPTLAEGNTQGPLTQPAYDGEPTSQFRYAVICSSNMNRSVEAHVTLKNEKFNVASFGCGSKVRLPGPTGPRAFAFGTTYESMEKTLREEDEGYYERNNVLNLLQRGARTKSCPERWQDVETSEVCKFDVVIVFETRLFETVIADIQSRDPEEFAPLHVICVDTKDNPLQAAESGKFVVEFCRKVSYNPLPCLKRPAFPPLSLFGRPSSVVSLCPVLFLAVVARGPTPNGVDSGSELFYCCGGGAVAASRDSMGSYPTPPGWSPPIDDAAFPLKNFLDQEWMDRARACCRTALARGTNFKGLGACMPSSSGRFRRHVPSPVHTTCRHPSCSDRTSQRRMPLVSAA